MTEEMEIYNRINREMREKYDDEWYKGQYKKWGEMVGKEKGERKKAEDIVKNMIKEGFDISLIVRITGLSEEEINNIKNSN